MELGARGKERTARQRRVIRVKGSASRGGGSGVEHEHEHEHEHEGPNVYNCIHSVSGKRERLPYNGIPDRRSCLTLCSILYALCSMLYALCSMLYSLLPAPCSLPVAPCPSRPGDEAELVVLL
jgi:hypothetical protein